MHIKLALVIVLLLVSCAGVSARENLLWPIVTKIWPVVKADCELGLKGKQPSTEITATIAQIEAAIRQDNYKLIHGAHWPVLEALAEIGVNERVRNLEISEGVAVSLRMRNKKFSEAMQELMNQ